MFTPACDETISVLSIKHGVEMFESRGTLPTTAYGGVEGLLFLPSDGVVFLQGNNSHLFISYNT